MESDTDKQIAALIAVGANLGNPVQAVRRAFVELEQTAGILSVNPAPLYESAPMYVEDQPRFVNSVSWVQTSLEPVALLDALKAIEIAIGRVKTYRNGPRAVDLDIVYYGDQCIDLPRLEIPHPRRLERRFVLAPAADISPGFVDPVSQKPLLELLKALDERPDGGGIASRIEG